MKHIVVATTNKNKKRELEKLVKDLKIKVIDFQDLNIHLPRIIEDGKTFRQNAIKKALTFSRYVDELVLADDSGIMVDALNGKPGVRSARFAKLNATDEENNEKLLRLMESIPLNKRQATFVSVIAVAKKGHLIGVAEGTCRGNIGIISKGKNGFGYDPLFTPKGKSKTFAELSPLYKNRISHRGKALRKSKAIIQKGLLTSYPDRHLQHP
jgi:non-canonical purine NTP pyrophosphatase (RdgB/HAM1 family)